MIQHQSLNRFSLGEPNGEKSDRVLRLADALGRRGSREAGNGPGRGVSGARALAGRVVGAPMGVGWALPAITVGGTSTTGGGR